MAEAQGSKGKYILFTLIAFIAVVGLLIVKPAFFWVALPFFLTYLAKSFDVI